MKTQNEQIKRVGFAYSRLSQSERDKESKDETETSLINAKEDIDVYCNTNHIELLYFGEERYKSGAKWDRGVVHETIAKAKEYALGHSSQIESGAIEVQFIVKNLSRLAREGVFQEINLREMEDPPYYIQVVSIEEGEIVKDRSLRLILGGMNERKVLDGRKSTEKRHANALGKGIPPIKAPFGYWNDKNIGNWQIDKEKEKIVLEFWKMYAEGKNHSEICTALKISTGLFYRILNNFENYLGKIIYRQKVKNYKGETVKVNRLVFDGKHKAIITDSGLVERVNKFRAGMK